MPDHFEYTMCSQTKRPMTGVYGVGLFHDYTLISFTGLPASPY